jgi:transcriptional regulator with XRE-family HTH domain
MDVLGRRLRERARELQLSDAEVARRAGLAERRYGHYVRGTREPDLATLLRICSALVVTPNDLLLSGMDEPNDRRESPLLNRLIAAAATLSDADLSLAVEQIEALAAHLGTNEGRAGP